MDGRHFREARKAANKDQIDVAVALGFRTQQAVSHIECGRRSIHVDKLVAAAKLFGASTDYLVGLTDDPTPAAELSQRPNAPQTSADASPATHSVEHSDAKPRPQDLPHARYVEIYEVAATAGGGAEINGERIKGWLAFRRTWLDEHALDPGRCMVIGVTGESMEPTLPDGCSILVDRQRRRQSHNGIYVIRTDEGIVVKRARRGTGGRWQMTSDHPAWSARPWPVAAEVIGEVRWMARTLCEGASVTDKTPSTHRRSS